MKKSEYVNGQFSWVDLSTSDTEAAKKFYTSMFGWDSVDKPTDMGPVYTMFMHEGESTCGMGPQSPEMAAAEAPPLWSSYVNVDDCEATVAKATELGGTVMTPTMKVMEEGWLAFIQDPTGAAIGLWQPNGHKGAGWVNSVGGFCWNELYTSDVAASKAFYEPLFGWELSGSPEYWSIKNAGESNGGMMKLKPEWGPVPPHWVVYFTVDSCAGAIEKAESLGASVFLPPMDVPEVGTFAGLADPQGGRFMVIEMNLVSGG